MHQGVSYCEPCLSSNLNSSVDFLQYSRISVYDIKTSIRNKKAKNNFAKFKTIQWYMHRCIIKNGFKELSVALLTRKIKINFDLHTVVCCGQAKRFICNRSLMFVSKVKILRSLCVDPHFGRHRSHFAQNSASK